MSSNSSQTMSITRALAELTLLSKRINRLTNLSYITTMTGDRAFAPEANQAKANWASLQDLMKRYRDIKFAIIKSNAITPVKIGNRTYTVAEAIAQKECFKFDTALLEALRTQRSNVRTYVESIDRKNQDKLDSLLELSFKDRKSSEDEIRIIKDAYMKSNEPKVLDLLDIDSRITQLEEAEEDFTRNVDFCLSESNAITMISV